MQRLPETKRNQNYNLSSVSCSTDRCVEVLLFIARPPGSEFTGVGVGSAIIGIKLDGLTRRYFILSSDHEIKSNAKWYELLTSSTVRVFETLRAPAV